MENPNPQTTIEEKDKGMHFWEITVLLVAGTMIVAGLVIAFLPF